jgi:predicted HTH domain antitoxin
MISLPNTYSSGDVKMSDISIKVPFDIVRAIRLPPDTIQEELQQELALALYQRGVLSSGKACDLAGVTRWEWEALLGARKIRRHYSDDEIDQDIAYATSGQ